MKNISIIKIFLTVLFLTALIIKINFFEIAQIIFNLNPVYLLGALILVPILYIIRTLKWNVLLSSAGITITFNKSLKVILIGNFYGLVTPGKVGELGRAYHLNEKKVLTLPTIIIEKMLDIFALVILSVLTIILFFQNNLIMIIGIFICVIVMIISIFMLVNEKAISFVTNFFKINQENNEQFVKNFWSLFHNYKIMGTTIFISFVYYFVAYLLGYFVILSAGFEPIVLITLPIIVLIGNIPITISGLGLRESIGSVAFISLGETAADGFVFAFLLFLLITLIPGIVGYTLTMKEH